MGDHDRRYEPQAPPMCLATSLKRQGTLDDGGPLRAARRLDRLKARPLTRCFSDVSSYARHELAPRRGWADVLPGGAVTPFPWLITGSRERPRRSKDVKKLGGGPT